MGKQQGGRWGSSAPGVPSPAEAGGAFARRPPTPTAFWVLVPACPSDTPVPVPEPARRHLRLPSGPTSPKRPPQKRPSQTSGLATLSRKHCLPGCPWRSATPDTAPPPPPQEAPAWLAPEVGLPQEASLAGQGRGRDSRSGTGQSACTRRGTSPGRACPAHAVPSRHAAASPLRPQSRLPSTNPYRFRPTGLRLCHVSRDQPSRPFLAHFRSLSRFLPSRILLFPGEHRGCLCCFSSPGSFVRPGWRLPSPQPAGPTRARGAGGRICPVPGGVCHPPSAQCNVGPRWTILGHWSVVTPACQGNCQAPYA